ncbi:MAG: hypothetical protein EA376_07940 [Phycisphaeraceae bacterium]|nr:MAG: hypothetical protein EA376_07940 [Phycisphaeraceae bacterium]
MSSSPALSAPAAAAFSGTLPSRPPALLASLVIAAILLTAVTAKIMSIMSTSSFAMSDFALIGAEIVIAFAVVAFHSKRLTWIGVTILFGAFAGFAGQRAFAGQSCGCFGEWNISARVTLGLDLVAISLGLALATRGARFGATSLGPLVTAAAVAAGIGVVASIATAPPPASEYELRTGRTTVGKLMSLPMMVDVREPTHRGPSWLVYIYNPDCPKCIEHLQDYDDYMAANPDDGLLRVHVVSMETLENEHDIPLWAWSDVPTTILVQGGLVTRRWGMDDVPNPYSVRESFMTEPDGVGRLLVNTPLISDIAQAGPDDPSWLVYIYNPTCPDCIEHLAVLRRFMEEHPDDPALRVRTLSMLELENSVNIPTWEWPGTPTTIHIRDGQVMGIHHTSDFLDPWSLREARLDRISED